MTFSRLEVHRFTCDECGIVKEQMIASEEFNVVEWEEEFILQLQNMGWVYCNSTGQHFCQKCRIGL